MSIHMQVSNVGLQYHSNQGSILQNVQLQIDEGEFVSMIGRSGSGKTSLLQMAAGLLKPSQGEVLVEGIPVTEPRTDTTYVFQKPVLLEWRTVLENVLLPLELERRVSEGDKLRGREILELVGLAGHEQKYPHQCSGGMLSRVALARGLLSNPRLLLMDEPFAALDAITKEQLQVELEEISSSLRATILFVTHDISEAIYLSDRILLLGGTPATVVQEFQVPFSRPRYKELRFTPEYTQLQKRIYEHIEKEHLAQVGEETEKTRKESG